MAEEVNEVQETPNTQVTAGDLATMVRIIDASSQRGAFRGEELETVGALRTKLATIVNALMPKQEETTDEVANETADVVEEQPSSTEDDSVNQ